MMTKQNAALLLAALLIVAIPFGLYYGKELSGTDDQAAKTIGAIRPDYEPWFAPLWNPGEAEALLFVLQGALGLGFIAYFFGYWRKQRTRVGQG